MEERHKKSLRSNRVLLVNDMKVDNIFLSRFRKDQVLQKNDMELIVSSRTSADKVAEFLRILVRRGPAAMPRLITALIETGQDDIARKLDPVLASATVGT